VNRIVNPNSPIRRRKAIPKSEEGYVMLLAIFLMALLALSLAVAAPKIARSIQRDRDLETFHRGMQYRRAIQLYYRKFHAYPPNVEALINTNDIRFLRKKYTDPITGQDDWKPIAFGQNKTPTAMGFFGQPLAGNASTLAGIGPSGGGAGPGTGLNGSQNSGGGAFGGSSFGGSSGSSGIFGSSGSGNDQSPPSGAPGSTDSTSGSSGASNGTDSSGTPGSTPGDTSSTGTGSNSGSPTFGGAGIIGFSPASDKTSILVYKKKQHYNEWEFTYDPLSDMQTVGGGNAGLVGQPASSTTTPVGAPTFGPSPSGPGSNPSPNPMPPETTPQ
jgi:type II secretory pathway pseudopilin PulG